MMNLESLKLALSSSGAIDAQEPLAPSSGATDAQELNVTVLKRS